MKKTYLRYYQLIFGSLYLLPFLLIITVYHNILLNSTIFFCFSVIFFTNTEMLIVILIVKVGGTFGEYG